MTKRFLFFIAALLCAASMWAYDGWAPWHLIEMRSGSCDKSINQSIAFNSLNNTHWGEITTFNAGNGWGYELKGTSGTNEKNAIFATYQTSLEVEPYTRRRMKWIFQLGSLGTKHHSTVCLYGMPDNYAQLTSLAVDFMTHHENGAGANYLLCPALTNRNQDGTWSYTREYTYYFDFDNRTGSTSQTKTWYIMTTHVVGSGKSKTDLDEIGVYRGVNPAYAWFGEEVFYYKQVTFHANGGEGSMEEQVIENSANLTANTFTRTGYTFVGWATTSGGSKAYNDGASITANSGSKGLVNLYAKWSLDTYTIGYDLDGGSAENPTGYTVETETFTLTNPTKAGYTFLGWTGSNGDVPQTEVTISQGSTGNKTYKANWQFTTAYLIDAIPNPVVHTDACHDAIIAALGSYTGLSDEQKALMSAADLEKLQAAVTAYDLLEGKSIIRFMDKDDAIIREHVMALALPEAPKIATYTFRYWQVVESNLSDGTIRIQAVYERDQTPGIITDIDETNADTQAAKFIRNGNVYILTDEFIYTINGQRVK